MKKINKILKKCSIDPFLGIFVAVLYGFGILIAEITQDGTKTLAYLIGVLVASIVGTYINNNAQHAPAGG